MTVPPPRAHGGDARRVAAALGVPAPDVLDLSVSLNPFAPDPLPILRHHLDDGVLNRYPDEAETARATDALAGSLDVDARRVLLTNGGAEAIALVAAELGRGWAEVEDFSLYRRHLRQVDPSGPRFRSDPHNPSGRLAPPAETAAVWDEAFYPLAASRWTKPGRTSRSVVVGSLTKVFALPGLRIGFLVTPEDDGADLGAPDLAVRLARRRPEWSVNSLALGALPELLALADPAAWTSAIASARDALVALLRDHGFAPLESSANFVLVPAAVGLRDALAHRGGRRP